MNRSELVDYHKQCCDRMHSTLQAKNADYSGANEDPFSNFRQVEHLGVASAEQGFVTRMMDKLSRVSSFVAKGVLLVKDESIEDTLLDLANYCILMAAYIKDKKQKAGEVLF